MMFTATLILFGQLLVSNAAPAPARPRPAAPVTTLARPVAAAPTLASAAAPVAVAPSTSSTPLALAGKVLAATGEPLPGVVVVVKGTSAITSTNATGDFLVHVTAAQNVLQFKCIGYRDRSMEVTEATPLTVRMFSTTQPAPAGMSAEEGATPNALTYSEELPTFPGGDAAYRAYIRQNAHYPETSLAKHASGTVYVSFVVDELGRVTDAAILKGCEEGLDQEALRLIRLMPWWSPGRVAGKAVRVVRTLPVPFVYRGSE
jgi:TonB family protein